ncbi:MAG: bi-domain-containing oxidoreductase, partial [Syntrophales bacterium]
MKQILQNLKTGATEIVDVPAPAVGRGRLLIRSSRTLVSAGTERMLVDFGKAGWIEKARQQPEKVKQVLDKIRTDGLMPTVEAVFNKLDEPMSLGYCNAGVVLEVGAGITDLHPGDRVASNGPHAEVVCVPRNLCAKIPDGVSDEEAAFTVLGAIALQGVRLAAPTLGERFMVFGLGMVGLLTVPLLRASGCPVLAVDVSETRLRLAEVFGAAPVDLRKGTDPVAAAMAWTGGRGVDGALIAASAKGDEIVHQAAQACRKRGRIVLVGVVDLNLRRGDFYEKELTFQVSCAYGPGRYDEKYEQGGQDYPVGFVRWTEQRNFEAVLGAMRSGQLRVKELITHRLALEAAAEAYGRVLHDPAALGIIIEYPGIKDNIAIQRKTRDDIRTEKCDEKLDSRLRGNDRVNVGVIGAGNYARSILLPALGRTMATLAAVADINGVAASHAARKFRAGKAVSDHRLILDDPGIHAVFVLVGHHLHARFVCEILEAGKYVFVEKPLAINETQLAEVVQVYEKICRIKDRIGSLPPCDDGKEQESDSGLRRNDKGGRTAQPFVMVGFNRRFSPHIVKIKELLAGRTEPLTMTMTVNAGFIPPEHWTQDPERGGGRIIGEGCHFIDLLSHLAGAPVATISAVMVGGNGMIREDRMSILLGFDDGSVGTVHYFANGSKSYPKETLEIFGDGRVIWMGNFRVTTGYGFKGFRSF